MPIAEGQKRGISSGWLPKVSEIREQKAPGPDADELASHCLIRAFDRLSYGHGLGQVSGVLLKASKTMTTSGMMSATKSGGQASPNSSVLATSS